MSRIAIVVSGHIPSGWAHSINAMKHAEGLRELGHEVEVFSVERYQERKALRLGASIHRTYDVNSDIPVRLFRDNCLFYWREVSLVRLLLGFFERTPMRHLGDPERQIAEVIAGEGFDWAYCRSLRAPAYLMKLGVPVVVERHNPDTADSAFQEFLRSIRPKFFLGISTIAESIKSNLAACGISPQKILVQEDAVDLKKFDAVQEPQSVLRAELHLPLEQSIVTYSGTLRRGKGIAALLEVAALLRGEAGVMFLIVGGPQELMERYEAAAVRKGLENIRFVGHVENYLVPRYLKASDALIMLYDENERRPVMDLYTTSPLKLFEYMASRVPIIASDIPALRRITPQGRELFFVPLGDTRAAGEVVMRVLRDAVLREGVVQRAYEVAQAHTYTKRCAALVAFAEA